MVKGSRSTHDSARKPRRKGRAMGCAASSDRTSGSAGKSAAEAAKARGQTRRRISSVIGELPLLFKNPRRSSQQKDAQRPGYGSGGSSNIGRRGSVNGRRGSADIRRGSVDVVRAPSRRNSLSIPANLKRRQSASSGDSPQGESPSQQSVLGAELIESNCSSSLKQMRACRSMSISEEPMLNEDNALSISEEPILNEDSHEDNALTGSHEASQEKRRLLLASSPVRVAPHGGRGR